MTKIEKLIETIMDRIDDPNSFTNYITKLLVPKTDIKPSNGKIVVLKTKPLYLAVRHFERYANPDEKAKLIQHLQNWLI